MSWLSAFSSRRDAFGFLEVVFPGLPAVFDYLFPSLLDTVIVHMLNCVLRMTDFRRPALTGLLAVSDARTGSFTADARLELAMLAVTVLTEH